MIPEFNSLTSSETELMHKAPILVCILVAGADGHIDQNEIRQAIGFVTNKHRKGKSKLLDFYDEVGNDFEDKLKIVIQGFPVKENERTPKVIAELKQLNQIIRRLDKDFSVEFYASLKEIALVIARSSGGVLGLRSVGEEEAQHLTLGMIQDPAAY